MEHDEVQATKKGHVFYHVTSPEKAERILADGFTDLIGVCECCRRESNGVWVFNYPDDYPDDGEERTILRMVLKSSLDALEDYEANIGASPREWCIPAALLNTRARVSVIDEDALPEIEFPDDWVD
jgi:hypothetical protein